MNIRESTCIRGMKNAFTGQFPLEWQGIRTELLVLKEYERNTRLMLVPPHSWQGLSERVIAGELCRLQNVESSVSLCGYDDGCVVDDSISMTTCLYLLTYHLDYNSLPTIALSPSAVAARFMASHSSLALTTHNHANLAS